MFTGLVEDKGTILEINRGADSARIRIATSLSSQLEIGDSISVNGVCLTAVDLEPESFSADVMVQTLKVTSLSSIAVGDPVNLELAARADGRLGGHIVQGHVDGIGKVVAIEAEEKWTKMVVSLPENLSKYIVNQGSITLDGVSLTVGEIDDAISAVTVWLIPETLSKTNLSSRKVGDVINIEVDILAKYVERLINKNSEGRS
jgi:riboflavin synthase